MSVVLLLVVPGLKEVTSNPGWGIIYSGSLKTSKKYLKILSIACLELSIYMSAGMSADASADASARISCWIIMTKT